MILKDVTYIENNNKILDKINLTFKSGTINGLIIPNEYYDNIVDLLSGQNKLTSGEIIFDKNKHSFKNISVVQSQISTDGTVLDRLLFIMTDLSLNFEEKIVRAIKALKMVGLDPDILNLELEHLSRSQIVLLSFAEVLIKNSDIILITNIVFELDKKSRQELKRILKLLKNKYHKTIIIMDLNVEFIYLLSAEVFVISDGVLVLSGTKYDVFNLENCLKYQIKLPKVLEFVNLVYDLKKVKLRKRDDINDLIKDIYRNIK